MSIPIFVINLPSSLERKARIKKMLSSSGIDSYTFHDGVDGKALPNDEIKDIQEKSSYLNKVRGLPLSPGEIGCAKSHLSVYQKIIDSSLDFAIILEDDVELDPLFKLFSESTYIQKNWKTFDLILLGYNILGSNNPGLPAKLRFKGRKQIADIPGLYLGKPAFFYNLTIGYFISQVGAKKLLDASKAFPRASDWLTGASEKYGVKMYLLNKPIAKPTMASLDHRNSTIGRRFNHRKRSKIKYFMICNLAKLGLSTYTKCKTFYRKTLHFKEKVCIFLIQLGLFKYSNPYKP